MLRRVIGLDLGGQFFDSALYHMSAVAQFGNMVELILVLAGSSLPLMKEPDGLACGDGGVGPRESHRSAYLIAFRHECFHSTCFAAHRTVVSNFVLAFFDHILQSSQLLADFDVLVEQMRQPAKSKEKGKGANGQAPIVKVIRVMAVRNSFATIQGIEFDTALR